jgi:hypothetical protein
MTVEVLIDGQVRSGQSVVQVRVDKQPIIGSAPPQVSRVNGEAVFVDLGGGKNVIAALASGDKAQLVDYPSYIAPALFGATFDGREPATGSALQGIRDVPADYLPTFVTFTDLNDSATARIVKPDEFAEVFGAGTELRGVRVEMTRDPRTENIQRQLPWWGKPIPWLRREGRGYIDMRHPDEFRWQRGIFKREY